MIIRSSMIPTKPHRRARRSRNADESGGILAVLADNKPTTTTSNQESLASAKNQNESSLLSSPPKAVVFSPDRIDRESGRADDCFGNDAVSEITSDLRTTQPSYTNHTGSKSPSSALSEEESEEESSETDEEEEDCSERESADDDSSSDKEEEGEGEIEEEHDSDDDDDEDEVVAWKEKRKLKLGDAYGDDDDDDDDSEMEYDNEDEYDPDDDDETVVEEDDDEDDSVELELDPDDIRVMQKRTSINIEHSSSAEKVGSEALEAEVFVASESAPSMVQEHETCNESLDGHGVSIVGSEEADECHHDDDDSEGAQIDEDDLLVALPSAIASSSKASQDHESETTSREIREAGHESVVVAEILLDGDSDDDSVVEVEVETEDEYIDINREDATPMDDESVSPQNDKESFVVGMTLETSRVEERLEINQRSPYSSENSSSVHELGPNLFEGHGGDEVDMYVPSAERPKTTVLHSSSPSDSTNKTGEEVVSEETLQQEPANQMLVEADPFSQLDDVSFVNQGQMSVWKLEEDEAEQAGVSKSPPLPRSKDIKRPLVQSHGTKKPINPRKEELQVVSAKTTVVPPSRPKKETDARAVQVPGKSEKDSKPAAISREASRIISQVSADKPEYASVHSQRERNFENSFARLRLEDPIAAQSEPSGGPPIRSDGIVKQGQWTIGSRIGVGSFGVVHVGMNKRNGSLMAVKSIPMKPEIMTDVRREIELLKTLNHTNIVRYYGAEINGSDLHIFQEWVAGGSVTDLLSKFGPFSFSVIQVYAEQILRGLEYLHSNDILHRDIKGSNILVSDEGIVKLADFGGSKKIAELNSDMMMSMTMRGTPYFMAPEVFEQKYSSKADVWAFACVLYQMATAMAPWKHLGFNSPFVLCRHLQTTDGPPALPRTLPATNGHLLNHFLAILGRCFCRIPFERPGVSELLHDSFFLEKDYFSDEENSEGPGLFSPEVVRTGEGLQPSPISKRGHMKVISSPVRNPPPSRTPNRLRRNSVGPSRSPFMSPPLPKRRDHRPASPIAYSPAKDTSDWPDWAKNKYNGRTQQTEGATSMMDSLAFSSDSSIAGVQSPMESTSKGSPLQGLTFVSSYTLRGEPTPP